MVNLAQRWILTVLLCNWIPLVICAKVRHQFYSLIPYVICYRHACNKQQVKLFSEVHKKLKKRKTIAYVFVIITLPVKLYFYISPKPYLVY